jgi:hypothetical protein
MKFILQTEWMRMNMLMKRVAPSCLYAVRLLALSFAWLIPVSPTVSAETIAEERRWNPVHDNYNGERYEVWASDQSNSVADAGAAGVRGSYLWIWDSQDIDAQLAGGPAAEPIGKDRAKVPVHCRRLVMMRHWRGMIRRPTCWKPPLMAST